MKKLEIKLRHFDELEAIMDREREAVSLNLNIESKKLKFNLYLVKQFSFIKDLLHK